MAPILIFITNHLEGLILLAMAAFGVNRVMKINSRQKYAKELLDKAMKLNLNEPLTLHPEIDLAKCTGCGVCTQVCPEGDILQMINHRPVLVSPTKCVGHGECERHCPMEAISLVFGTKTRGIDIPRLNTDYQTNVPGLYIAGELGGMGLIRNAVKQGVVAATHALQNLPQKKTGQFDIFIIGAGPAGFASSLVAVAHKKSYMAIEQNSLGGTVYNFPRQKIVMSYPADLPIVGQMKFKSNKISKEELLSYWRNVQVKAGIKISEKTRFLGLEKMDGHFVVKTDKGDFTASKVVLAMGVRGTPRQLGLPNEDLQKVTYNLLDPEQYQGQQVCVVGGGNAGVEAAQMLANPKYKNRVTLLVRGSSFDRCNEENEKTIRAMVAKGQLELWFDSSVKQIEPSHLIVTRAKKDIKIDNSYLFIFAGAEMPHRFLMGLGVEIEKKFGEKLAKSA